MKTKIRPGSGWYWCIAITLLVMGGLVQAANESQELTSSDAAVPDSCACPATLLKSVRMSCVVTCFGCKPSKRDSGGIA
jgi:hypothetical protein